MADTKISALAAVTLPLTTDEFAINQGGASKKMTLAQTRGSGWISVKDYGAVGDGVTNDTTAINNAIAAAPSFSSGKGGTVVYFPAGKYIVTSTIAIPSTKSGISLLGAGRAATWLSGSVSGGPVLSTYYDGTGTVTLANISIKGMVIYNTSAGASSSGLRIAQAGFVFIEECTVVTAAAYPGTLLDSGYNIYLTGCDLRGGTYGIRVGYEGLGGVNVIRFANCTFTGAPGGAHVIGSTAVAFDMCHFEGLTGGAGNDAIYLDSCTGVQVNSCYFEDAGNYFIRTSGASYGLTASLTVQACYMYNVDTGFIDLTDCSHAVILPNTMRTGANNANPTGISSITNGYQVTVAPQHFVDWGSGVAIDPSNYNQNTSGFGPYNCDGTPTTGLNGTAEKGALCIDYTNGKLYINTGTKASNTWTVVGTQT